MILKLLTTHGTLFDSPVMISGQVGTFPSLTGAWNGQARPNILCRTGRGLSVAPSCLELAGNLLLLSMLFIVDGLW